VGAELKSTGERYDIATTQMHQTIMDRDLVRETVIGQFAKDISSGNKAKKDFAFENLYSDYKDLKTGHHWGMVVDLTACIGCGACVVACNSENNVSVVGKKEVLRGREMHWMRIDRYFSSSTEDIEKGAEYPDVVFQPLMCQHCDNAPCENVCPVLATVHSDEGLNQMVYNRCIGTRYCANNCPYKVRRFNWFDYTNRENFPYNPGEGDISRLVLNPDVTVRARGVMEKCSFCVQRIQTAKLTAKMEQRPLKDGDIKVACQSSCPTGCIKFGDLNDPNSEVAKAFAGRRSYALLEEVKTKPTVNYLVKVRNRAADAPAAGSEA
jgi:molybdopterin-containing oxidoreductase family iron-sulfur binding subunit